MSDKLYTQINDELIELAGDALQELLELRNELAEQEVQLESKRLADKQAKEALLERLGITEAEAKLLLS
jgi:AmiR/NasT family two-component response regulator